MKIGLYITAVILSIFVYIIPLHIVYSPTASSITVFFGLVFLALLLIELYRKYTPRIKHPNIFKWVLVLLWIIICISQIEYIPSIKIKVTDVFGKPLENIPVFFWDDMGCYGIGHCSTVHRFPEPAYTTNSLGEIASKPRFYFGQDKAEIRFMSVNRARDTIYEGSGRYGISVNNTNDFYDSKEAILKGENLSERFLAREDYTSPSSTHEMVLSPFKVKIADCNIITDTKKRSECLVYGQFYSAVQEKNSQLCNAYNNPEIKSALNGAHTYFLRREGEVYNECKILVEGIINNNPSVCSQIKNMETRLYKDQCDCVVTNSCTVEENYYQEEFNTIRPLYKKDLHGYLCEKDANAPSILAPYKNYPIRFVDTASDLYRKMFCE